MSSGGTGSLSFMDRQRLRRWIVPVRGFSGQGITRRRQSFEHLRARWHGAHLLVVAFRNRRRARRGRLHSTAHHLIGRNVKATPTIKPTKTSDERIAAIIFALGSSFHELRRRVWRAIISSPVFCSWPPQNAFGAFFAARPVLAQLIHRFRDRLHFKTSQQRLHDPHCHPRGQQLRVSHAGRWRRPSNGPNPLENDEQVGPLTEAYRRIVVLPPSGSYGEEPQTVSRIRAATKGAILLLAEAEDHRLRAAACRHQRQPCTNGR